MSEIKLTLRQAEKIHDRCIKDLSITKKEEFIRFMKREGFIINPVEEAKNIINSLKRIVINTGDGFIPLADLEILIDAFEYLKLQEKIR